MKQLLLITTIFWTSFSSAQIVKSQEVLDVFFYSETLTAISSFILKRGELNEKFEQGEKIKYYDVPTKESMMLMFVSYKANKIGMIGIIVDLKMAGQIKRDYQDLQFNIGATLQDNLYNFKNRIMYQFDLLDGTNYKVIRATEGEEMMRTLSNGGLKVTPVATQQKMKK